jgi:hypothetical protein
MFEIRVLKRVFEPYKQEVHPPERQKKLHNKELHDLDSLPDTARNQIKKDNDGWDK